MRPAFLPTRTFALVLITLTISFSAAFGQTRATWNTAADVEVGKAGKLAGIIADVDAARLRFALLPEGDAAGNVVAITADAASTVYYGFGRESEVFRGADGFSQLRAGDRVDVRGVGARGPAITAMDIILTGRAVAPGAPGTASIQAAPGAPSTAIEGVVRQVGTNADSLVVETSGREMITVTGAAPSTPVYYKGTTYRISNVEVGDRVSIDPETRSGGNVRARSITVLQSVPPGSPGANRTLTSLIGRVTRVDDRIQTFRVATAKGEVRVDARYAYDERGSRFKMSQIHTGDVVEISGGPDAQGNFRADTVRLRAGTVEPALGRPAEEPVVVPAPRDPVDQDEEAEDDEEAPATLRTVMIYGTIEADLRDSDKLRVLDTTSDRTVEITLVDDFVVRLQNGNYVTADQLKNGDRVVIQAFRVGTDRYIAQTIRTR